jgi:pilus assembly protein CpaB
LSTRVRTFLIIFVGLVLFIVGVGASLLLINRINAQTQAAQRISQAVTSPVVVVTRDMRLGDKISEKDVNISQVPVNLIPRDSLSTPDAAVGKIIKSDLVQGEMVLQHNLADPTNSNHDLSFILSEDHVLMAFPATDLMSRENVIQRGDVIDILATFQVSDKNLGAPLTTTNPSAPTTQTETGNTSSNFTTNVFQKVTVTAVVLQVVLDQNGADTGKTAISSYLLALNPQDALVLKYLKDSQAVFDFVLRAPTSQTEFNLTSVGEQYIIDQFGLNLLH